MAVYGYFQSSIISQPHKRPEDRARLFRVSASTHHALGLRIENTVVYSSLRHASTHEYTLSRRIAAARLALKRFTCKPSCSNPCGAVN